ncbi:agamous-like MADS-box protein AGL82 [Tanacetum coccineum]
MVGVTRMELIASDKKRVLTFQGRVKGMKKKAYELSTLCGLDIGMIICSPSGQIETLSWPNQQDDDGKTLLDLIESYKNQDELDVKSEKELRESVMCLDSKIERVKERIHYLKKEKQPQDTSFIEDYEIMDSDDLVFLLNNIMDQPVTPIHEDSSTAWSHDLPSLVQPKSATFASNNDTSCHSNIPSVMTTGGYPMISQVMIGRAAFQEFTYNINLHDAPQYTNDNGDHCGKKLMKWTHIAFASAPPELADVPSAFWPCKVTNVKSYL